MADFKHIVRIVNADLKGDVPIRHALTKIKGIGYILANSICNVAEIEKTKKTGHLNEAEVKKIDEVIHNPTKFKIPFWMFNRRKDYETGVDKHVLTSEMDLSKTNDLRRLKRIKSYRGMRHAFGLPVRGQRTRSNFRKNKGKVTGVKRKAGKK